MIANPLVRAVCKPGLLFRVTMLICLTAVGLFGTVGRSSRQIRSRTVVAQAQLKPEAAGLATTVGLQSTARFAPEQAQIMNAAQPFSTRPNPPAAPFVLPNVNEVDRRRAVKCLATAVYYEAASQGEQGEAAVAQVVLNRVRNPMFPKTICGVVFEGSRLASGCQFTFTCDGSLSRRPTTDGWRRAVDVAQEALAGHVEQEVGEATHYHTIWVVPYWQAFVEKVAQVGAHIFYRWRGDVGRPEAFSGHYGGFEPNSPLPPGFDAVDPKPTTRVALSKVDTVAMVVAAARRPNLRVEAPRSAPDLLAPAIRPTDLAASPRYFGDDQDHPTHHLPVPTM